MMHQLLELETKLMELNLEWFSAKDEIEKEEIEHTKNILEHKAAGHYAMRRATK